MFDTEMRAASAAQTGDSLLNSFTKSYAADFLRIASAGNHGGCALRTASHSSYECPASRYRLLPAHTFAPSPALHIKWSRQKVGLSSSEVGGSVVVQNAVCILPRFYAGPCRDESRQRLVHYSHGRRVSMCARFSLRDCHGEPASFSFWPCRYHHPVNAECDLPSVHRVLIHGSPLEDVAKFICPSFSPCTGGDFCCPNKPPVRWVLFVLVWLHFF